MALSLRDCNFFGPALPEPFVLNNLEGKLTDLRLLPRNVGDEGHALQQAWEVFRRKLRDLGEHGGDRRVFSHVLEPLSSQLGYASVVFQESVITREGAEDGGTLFLASGGQKLRVWAAALGTDLDAPNRRGRAYRFSASRVAQRVLLASGERAGLLSEGEELRLLICDPARPDSHIAVDLGRSGGWRSARNVPDSYRLIHALASPSGVAALPDLAEAARLAQSQVTKKLRLQARAAIEGFLQEVIDHPANQSMLGEAGTSDALARQLWREGLIIVYRLLFVFKLESSADPARAFSFAATSLWRRTYSPNTALADIARKVLDDGADSGGFLEGALRALWRMFAEGLSSSELEIKALGGMLFGEGATPLLDRLGWGERAVARLLDALLWTPVEGRAERERVHYGALDVEDLGRVYEALLELEPGISTEPMSRLRRAKLEVVVPAAQGAPYRASAASVSGIAVADDEEESGEDVGADEDTEEAEAPQRRAAGGRTQVVFIEDIPANRFFLRVGLGRKATGSYYTPHPFVRFLVQETLGPQLLERSPKEEPQPGRFLELKVIDPAMGSGHFLVEACRFLGEALYEACRLCDELAVQAEEQATKLKELEQVPFLARAAELRKRVEDLPDPEDELVAYLPSRVPEGEDSGLSQKKAEALCRRLVAVHCLYGVDKNPLAVELAKLSLWLESYAEGLPLTFMDHRLVCGDSLTGPFFEHLLNYPGSGNKLDDLYTHGLTEQLRATLSNALTHVRDLEASVGKDVADLEQKRVAKEKLDAALNPLKLLAAGWSGGVMLGKACDDAAYLSLAMAIANSGDKEAVLAAQPRLRDMVEAGRDGVPFELEFPEVFHSITGSRQGFDVVIGNPPWDALQPYAKEFFAAFDLGVLDAPTRKERAEVEKRLAEDPHVAALFDVFIAGFDRAKQSINRMTNHVGRQAGGRSSGAISDVWQVFAERGCTLLRRGGFVGYILPSAFHANQSATGLRSLYIEHMGLRCCFSFENRRKLFDIDSRFKFAAVVAQNDPNGTDTFECGFYWHEIEKLYEADGRLRYTVGFVRETGGNYLSLIELQTQMDVDIAAVLYCSGISMGHALEKAVIRTGEEIHMSKGAYRFTPVSPTLPTGVDPRSPRVAIELREHGYLPLHEGKTFHQFDDSWGDRPRYLVALTALSDRADWLRCSRYYRLAYRAIASSTNERTGIFCMLPPGVICGNSSPVERAPKERANSAVLQMIGTTNSFAFDWALRQKTSANVNLFILNGCPFPSLDALCNRFMAHASLRLSCNHKGYSPLWDEQVGGTWREAESEQTWPVLEGDDARWAVRAVLDAVVAEAYGLDRVQYVHVLSTFSHRSYPKAPELCIAAYDELKETGLEHFTKKYDPYWDIPLNENLPQPVIDLAIPGQEASATENFGPMFADLQSAPTPAPVPAPRPAPLPQAPRPPRAEGNQCYDTLKALLQERGDISSGDAQEATGLDAVGVRPLLRRLVDEGLAETEGQRRGMRYRRRGGA